MVLSLYRGETANLETRFEKQNKQPFQVQNPVSYNLFDFTGELVMSGSATQDAGDPARWTSNVQIPNTAPISEIGEKYSIEWAALNETQSMINKEYFMLKDKDDPIALDDSILILEGKPLTDFILLDTPVDSTIKLRLLDYEGIEVLNDTIDKNNYDIKGRFIRYKYSSTSLTNESFNGFAPFFLEWNYELGIDRVEVHPVYYINTKMYMIMDGVRKIIDKARNDDVNPNLRIEEFDLAHFVLDGLQVVNNSNPTLTNWTIKDLPDNFIEFVKKAASYEALRSHYLAEGVAAFDFQGQSVQLKVDRTRYIQTVMSSLNQELERKLQKTKSLYIKSSSPGVMNLTVSTNTNLSYYYDFYYLHRFRGGYQHRFY